MWETIIPSGSPLCSCRTTRSVMFYSLHILTMSFNTYAPLFILTEPGTTSLISFWNCNSRIEGVLLVVISTDGSLYFASSYSSSIWLQGIRVLISSCSNSLMSLSFSLLNSFGMLFPPTVTNSLTLNSIFQFPLLLSSLFLLNLFFLVVQVFFSQPNAFSYHN